MIDKLSPAALGPVLGAKLRAGGDWETGPRLEIFVGSHGDILMDMDSLSRLWRDPRETTSGRAMSAPENRQNAIPA